MKTIYRLFLVLLFSISISSCFQDKPGTIIKVSPEEAESLIETNKVKLIDVRKDLDFNKKHLKGAVNMEIENTDLKKILSSLDKEEPLLLYCNKGGQSARCAKILEENGFLKIYDLTGGIQQWEKSGRKVIVQN